MRNPTRWAVSAALIASLPLLGGCATEPEPTNGAVAQARQAYEEASRNPQVRDNAPIPLYEARQALEQAEMAESEAVRRHYAYLAEQHVAVARTMAEQNVLEQEVQQLVEQRGVDTELAALEARRTDRGYLVTLQDVLFETGRADIKAGADSMFDRLARYLARNPERQLLVEGHTDSRGPERYNFQLSEQRAESIKQALTGRGIDPSRIRTRGYGEFRPIAPNDSEAGRQLNRRVEILILDQ